MQLTAVWLDQQLKRLTEHAGGAGLAFSTADLGMTPGPFPDPGVGL